MEELQAREFTPVTGPLALEVFHQGKEGRVVVQGGQERVIAKRGIIGESKRARFSQERNGIRRLANKGVGFRNVMPGVVRVKEGFALQGPDNSLLGAPLLSALGP